MPALPSSAMTVIPPAPSSQALEALRSNQVPLESLSEACSGCSVEASDDVEGYPKGFDVDMDSDMLGSVKPYGRQILISSGKSDWEREVTDSGLPSYIKSAYDDVLASLPSESSGGLFGKLAAKLKGTPTGVYDGIFDSTAQLDRSNASAAASSRLSIVSSSLLSSADDEAEQTVIVLPDFKIVQGVSETKEAAKDLVEAYLSPTIGRAGLPSPRSSLRSWPLPYRALVLICSHKRRDKRCHIAAPLLIDQFHHHLYHHSFEIDERGDDIHCPSDDSIESWPAETRAEKFDDALGRTVAVQTQSEGSSRVGLFKISHIGGHRYAGNVIVYLPNGASVWYGRVTPKDVGAIVESTIINGKIIPELLRGGMGLTGKQQPGGVLNW